jgi:lysophospholipase L1-like esterase
MICVVTAVMPACFAQPSGAVVKNLKFDFGTGNPVAGFQKVTAENMYSNEKGYGFDFGSAPKGVSRGGKGGVNSDFVTSDNAFYFSVALPEGNYNVSVTMGDMQDSSTTTIKAESRRLMVEKQHTGRGKFITRTFTVNVKSRRINATDTVILKPRELTKLDWDDKLTFEFNDSRPCITAMEISPAANAVTVFLAGNSTVVNQDDEPWASWGQMIPLYFRQGLAIANHAESGLSLGSFIGSKRLQKILSVMKPGDYLFVEFGHNDQKEKGPNDGAFKSYEERLRQIIVEVRSKQGIPVLVTPTNRRTFDAGGSITNSLGDYPDAVRKVARDERVALIDLNAMTKVLYETLGPEKSVKAFVHYPAGTYPGQDKELKDDTHFNAYGAYEIARCIISGIRSSKLALTDFFTSAASSFDPAYPDALERWSLAPSPKSTVLKPDGN